VPDLLVAESCGNTTGYVVKYYAGSTEITSQVTAAAGYSTPQIAPLATHPIVLRIFVKSTATRSKTCSIRTASRSASIRDVVNVVLKPY
jgi:hypothetical protein